MSLLAMSRHRRLDTSNLREIRGCFEAGKSISETSDLTGVNPFTLKQYRTAIAQGFNGLKEYRNDFAQRKGYKDWRSYCAIQNEIRKTSDIPLQEWDLEALSRLFRTYNVPTTERDLEIKRLESCLEALKEESPKHYKVLVDKFLKGYSLRETGRELGLTCEGVRRREKRALGLLRRLYARSND